MESNHTSQDFNFQYYVDMAKQKEIAWHVFVKLIKDFSYSDISKLKYVNAILLTKLTDSYSDMERLKYLNVILHNLVFSNFFLYEKLIWADVDYELVESISSIINTYNVSLKGLLECLCLTFAVVCLLLLEIYS